MPFLILADGVLAGFALRTASSRLGHEGPTSNVAEFFVVRACQRSGVGRAAARALFDRFPGRWEVAQLGANTPARSFWRTVLGEYTNGAYVEHTLATDAWGRTVQTFSTPSNP